MNLFRKLRDKQRLSLIAIFTLTTLLSISLLAIRIHFTERITFLFLAWNTILALIPYAISTLLVVYHEKVKHRHLLWVPILCWLCFFPNAPYILTDLFHLRARPGVPYWFDLALIFSFAWNGVMLGFASLYDIQHVIAERFGKLTGWISSFSFLILCGFGIYLGRYLRWNSWDVVSSPAGLVEDIVNRIVNPSHYPHTYGVTIVYSAFLILGYLMIINIGKLTCEKDLKVKA